jgi:hypothetical protein
MWSIGRAGPRARIKVHTVESGTAGSGSIFIRHTVRQIAGSRTSDPH